MSEEDDKTLAATQAEKLTHSACMHWSRIKHDMSHQAMKAAKESGLPIDSALKLTASIFETISDLSGDHAELLRESAHDADETWW